ncbi:MAG TPA: hypothetical protein DCS93_15810, partial [Microscillaceae bacterium]|nr:hypothetical protein [Microscillaceae bacterium]
HLKTTQANLETQVDELIQQKAKLKNQLHRKRKKTTRQAPKNRHKGTSRDWLKTPDIQPVTDTPKEAAGRVKTQTEFIRSVNMGRRMIAPRVRKR